MSRSIDLFIASSEPLDSVAKRVGEVAKLPILEDPDGGWVVRDEDTSVTLTEHRYLDDGDLFLGRYRYVLSGRVPPTARPQDTPVAALLRRIACEVQHATAWPVLLVLDLQYREAVPGRDPHDSSAPPVTSSATETPDTAEESGAAPADTPDGTLP